MRNYNELEKHLLTLGFTELFGIGLWGKEEFGTAIDTNTGSAKVYPYIDASYDNFVGFAKTIDELNVVIERSETSEFFIAERKEKFESIK